MRAVLMILGLVALAGAAAMQFGMVTLNQTQAGVVQPPRFEADVGRVSVDVAKPTPTP